MSWQNPSPMWYQSEYRTPVCSRPIRPLLLLFSLNHLQNESGSGSEHSTRATSNLDGCAGELRGRGRCGCGSDRGGTGGHGARGGVVSAGRRSDGHAGAVRGDSGVDTLHGEVGAADAGLVGQVEHERELAEVAGVTHLGGEEGVDVSISWFSM
jgi:hypothetical protein